MEGQAFQELQGHGPVGRQLQRKAPMGCKQPAWNERQRKPGWHSSLQQAQFFYSVSSPLVASGPLLMPTCASPISFSEEAARATVPEQQPKPRDPQWPCRQHQVECHSAQPSFNASQTVPARLQVCYSANFAKKAFGGKPPSPRGCHCASSGGKNGLRLTFSNYCKGV